MLNDMGLRIGQEIVKHAARAWIGQRKKNEVRNADLVDMMAVGVVDQFHRRKLARQWEEIGDQIAQRLIPLLQAEATLPDHECQAALDAVVDTLTGADLSDRAVFDADADALTLARRIRQDLSGVARNAGLSEPGKQLYQRVLDETCQCLVSVLQEIPAFEPRALTELLRRLSAATDQIGQVLERLPRITLDAPRGTGHDAEFTSRYLTYISDTLDQLELFGIDLHRYRPRTSVSLAYLSLSVTGTRGDRFARTGHQWNDRRSASDRGLRVEHALGESHRTLLRGDAGSGKTTLLQWIAINAARHTFTGPLTRWNGVVPFVVWLREHADGDLPQPEHLVTRSAGPIAGQMPEGWAHRHFTDGTALLLVDGVDELTAQRRASVRRWLSRLVAAFPDIGLVVTSRPVAAEARWLDEEGFHSLSLEPMTPADVDTFSRRWHDAIRHAASNGADLPCTVTELADYEASLAQHIDSQRHLRTLATNPLMCAMLCALNLDRRKQLPPDRMKLYEAALEMLIDRRDAEREVPTGRHPTLDVTSKVALLQYVAWWLTQCGRAEIGMDDAIQRVEYALARMPNLNLQAEPAVHYLVERSGVLRQPRLGRVDFIHRTFQEYLAGKQAAEEHLIDVLIRHAHLDQWRETVIMAAGHCTPRLRDELLTGMLDRADHESRHARRLQLVTAACLDTAHTVSPNVADRVEATLDALIPPRRRKEARSLALAGERLLDHLPSRLDDLSEAAAAACVRAATSISGPKALSVLAEYAHDPRVQIQGELARAWKFFNPKEYAQNVLAHAPLINGIVAVERTEHLPYLDQLHALRETQLDLMADQIDDLSLLNDIPNLTSLVMFEEGPPLDLRPLLRHTHLKRIWVMNRACTGLDDLHELEQLSTLHVPLPSGTSTLEFARRLRNLRLFAIANGHDVQDISPLNDLKITELGFWDCETLTDLSQWTPSIELNNLSINEAPLEEGAHALESLIPQLSELVLHTCPTVTDLSPIHRATQLSQLWICRCPVADITALANARELQDLAVPWTDVADISPIVELPKLHRLDLRGLSPELDLRPLLDRKHSPKLEVWLSPGHHPRGLETVRHHIQLKRV